MNRNFAIIGCPLGHTMSPPIHKRLFELSGKSGEYSAMPIDPEKLGEKIAELKKLDGFNITIPFKVNIIKYLDKLSPSAQRYGSVNTVACGEQCIGYNTDVDGFVKTMRSYNIAFDGRVCIIGAGGAGRMFAIETALNGAEVTLAVRKSSLELAQQVKADILLQKPDAQVIVTEISQLNGGGYELIINASPCGMYPNTNDMPDITENTLKNTKAVFDSIYNPSETKFMQLAKSCGCVAVGGMDMLVWQAVAAHEIWDNAVYSDSDIKALIAEMRRELDKKFKA